MAVLFLCLPDKAASYSHSFVTQKQVDALVST